MRWLNIDKICTNPSKAALSISNSNGNKTTAYMWPLYSSPDELNQYVIQPSKIVYCSGHAWKVSQSCRQKVVGDPIVWRIEAILEVGLFLKMSLHRHAENYCRSEPALCCFLSGGSQQMLSESRIYSPPHKSLRLDEQYLRLKRETLERWVTYNYKHPPSFVRKILSKTIIKLHLSMTFFGLTVYRIE